MVPTMLLSTGALVSASVSPVLSFDAASAEVSSPALPVSFADVSSPALPASSADVSSPALPASSAEVSVSLTAFAVREDFEVSKPARTVSAYTTVSPLLPSANTNPAARQNAVNFAIPFFISPQPPYCYVVE